jgi:hypothetical protein
VDVIAKGLTSEEGVRYCRGCNERPGSRAQLDHRLFLVIEAALGFLVGEPESLGIRFGGRDRSRMHSKPDVQRLLADPKSAQM